MKWMTLKKVVSATVGVASLAEWVLIGVLTPTDGLEGASPAAGLATF